MNDFFKIALMLLLCTGLVVAQGSQSSPIAEHGIVFGEMVSGVYDPGEPLEVGELEHYIEFNAPVTAVTITWHWGYPVGEEQIVAEVDPLDPKAWYFPTPPEMRGTDKVVFWDGGGEEPNWIVYHAFNKLEIHYCMTIAGQGQWFFLIVDLTESLYSPHI